MPNIATLLKSEISRVARKEMRGEMQELKKATTHYRTRIAALNRRIQNLERQVAHLRKTTSATASEDSSEEPEKSLRFSAKGFASQRRRLGLSAHALAALLGVSAQSVYKWEDGKTRPRASQLQAIASLRKMGKREAVARLQPTVRRRRAG